MKRAPAFPLPLPRFRSPHVLLALTALVAMFNFVALAQTAAPVKVVKVGEASSLPLAAGAGFSGSAAAYEGHRYVTVELQFAPSVNVIETGNLLLVSTDGKVFASRGMGNAEGQYCMMVSLSLKREGEEFGSWCAMTSGGRVSLSFFKTNKPTAAFPVPASVLLSALELSYSVPVGVVPVDPPTLNNLSNGLSAEVKEVTELASPSLRTKAVTFLVEVRNNGRHPFRVHSGTIQLHVPEKPDEKGEITWSWESLETGAADQTGAAGGEKREPKPLLVLAPGETRTLGLGFRVSKDVDIKRCELGFFREQVIHLAAVARSAPAAVPKK